MVDMANDLSAVGLEIWLASPLLRCNDPAKLRKAACECAKLAVEQCEYASPDMLEAMSLAERMETNSADARVLEVTRRELAHRLTEAEDRELEAQSAESEGLAQRLRSLRASATARAYACLERALHEDARWSAATAAYEVHAALGIAGEISQLQQLSQIVHSVVPDEGDIEKGRT